MNRARLLATVQLLVDRDKNDPRIDSLPQACRARRAASSDRARTG